MLTFRRAHEEYLLFLKSQGNSKNDIKNHKYRVSSFCRFIYSSHKSPLCDLSMKKLKPFMIDEWLASEQERGIAQTTISGYLQTVQFVEKFARERYPNRCSKKPLSFHHTVRKNTARDDDPVLEREDLLLMVNAAKAMTKSSVLNQIASAVVFLTVIETAIRNGEVKTLTMDRLGLDSPQGVIDKDGNIENYYIMRVEGEAKTGKSEIRNAFYGDKLANYLKRWLAVRPHVNHNYVFTRVTNCPWHAPFEQHPTCPQCLRHGLPHSSESIRKCNRHVARIAGFSGRMKDALPHALRHAVGRYIVDQGHPKIAQKRLGHKKLDTTLTIYGHQDNSRVALNTIETSLL